MKVKIEIKSVFGSALFELDKEDNTIKDTLIEAIKSGANLRGANLFSADLRNADLRNANLRDANLCDADLRNANLRGANLFSADLSNANLCGANLCDADLCGADLCGANLCDVNLYAAYLGGANLRDANLCGANLRNADLCGANLRNAKNIPFIPTYLPEGEFIGWKKLPNGIIAKLKILNDSKRSRSTGDKCRCDKCLVLEFQNVDGSIADLKTYVSYEYAECIYTVGEMVEADMWDKNRFNECSHGIHFFIDRQSAVNY